MPVWSSVLLALLSLVALIAVLAWQARRRRVRARQLYQRRLETALEDGLLTPDEVDELERLRVDEDLSPAEVRVVARAIYRSALKDVLADAKLTDEEDAALRRLQTQLGLQERELGRDHVQLSRLRLFAQVESGRLPVVDAPIPLVSEEICHWVVQASLAERLGHPRSGPPPRGVSFRVAGPEPFHVDGDRDALRPLESILPIDLGVLIVTSRRTVFQGAKRTLSVPHARLETLVLHDDGLRLDELGGNTRGYVLVDDAELTAAIVLQAARRRRADIRPVRSGRSA
jgi:hypothetical protein